MFGAYDAAGAVDVAWVAFVGVAVCVVVVNELVASELGVEYSAAPGFAYLGSCGSARSA